MKAFLLWMLGCCLTQRTSGIVVPQEDLGGIRDHGGSKQSSPGFVSSQLRSKSLFPLRQLRKWGKTSRVKALPVPPVPEGLPEAKKGEEADSRTTLLQPQAQVVTQSHVDDWSPEPLLVRARKQVHFMKRKSEHDDAILGLALPTLGAVLIDPCLSLVDTAWVGRIGPVALGSIGPCTALFNFVSATSYSVFMVSTSVLVAKYGALDDTPSIGRSMMVALAASLALGLPLTTTWMLHPQWFLKLMGAPPALMGDACSYLVWRSLAMPASLFLLIAGGAYRGIGKPSATFRNGLLVCGVNLVLDPLLIFGLGWGVKGAAVATSAAQWAGALAYTIGIWRQKGVFGLDVGAKGSWKDRVPTMKDFKMFAACPDPKLLATHPTEAGGALFFRALCNVGAWTAMAMAATRMGVYEIAAHQVVLGLWLLLAYMQDALGVAGQVLVAQHLSQAKAAESVGQKAGLTLTARTIAKRVISMSFMLGSFLSVTMVTLVPTVVPMLCSGAAEVSVLAQRVLSVMLGSLAMCCLVWAADSVFYGAYDIWYNAKAIALSSTVSFAGIAATLRYGWGLMGLWGVMTYGYFGCRLAGHYLRFNSHSGPFGRASSYLESQLEKDEVLVPKKA